MVVTFAFIKIAGALEKPPEEPRIIDVVKKTGGNDMDVLVFKVRRVHFVWRLCLLLLPAVVLVEIMAYGLFPLSRIFNYIIGGVGGIWLVGMGSFFLPFNNLTIVLGERSLKAPSINRPFFNSITVDLSEVLISKTIVDWLHGFKVSTLDGQGICISSLFYGRKARKCIINEIELRKSKGSEN